MSVHPLIIFYDWFMAGIALAAGASFLLSAAYGASLLVRTIANRVRRPA